MVLAIAILLSAEVVQGNVAGRIVDALKGKPVSGAVVSDGQHGGTLTDEEGRFVLSGLSGEAVDVIVQHPSYLLFAEPRVQLGARVEIKLRPSSIQAEAMEIVETREEDLRPMIVRQDKIPLTDELSFLYRGRDVKGVYRVCVGTDGKVSMVAALVPAAKADMAVKAGIARGWEYRALPKPACFVWRVTLRFSGMAKATPNGPSILPPPAAPPPPAYPPSGSPSPLNR
jgi:Carboxypeptidase regulatory-like domain